MNGTNTPYQQRVDWELYAKQLKQDCERLRDLLQQLVDADDLPVGIGWPESYPKIVAKAREALKQK